LKRIARVFPRITKATPQDQLTFFTEEPPMMILPDMDEIHVSVTFTYDKEKAEDIAENWRQVGVPVKVSGPAYGDRTIDFEPGMYLRKGYVITSTGCHNKCWHCSVWRRVDKLYELPIKDGWIVQDDNFLLCSKAHIIAVAEMLKRQKHRPIFSGGLEAAILEPWHVELMQELKPSEMFFAYDTPDDYEPLIVAGKMLDEAGFTLKSRKKLCYCLIGYPKDTFEKAEKRLIDILKAGFIPFAMLYKNEKGEEDETWRRFQRLWSRPAIIVSRNKEFFK
jgi:hypothetical protein